MTNAKKSAEAEAKAKAKEDAKAEAEAKKEADKKAKADADAEKKAKKEVEKVDVTMGYKNYVVGKNKHGEVLKRVLRVAVGVGPNNAEVLDVQCDGVSFRLSRAEAEKNLRK